MNCLDFRRHFMADPYTKDALIHAHIAECTGCAKQAEQILQFEALLTTAMKVDPPEGLNERILMREALPHGRTSRRTIRYLAIAASVLVASFVTLNLTTPNNSNPSVDLLAVQHVVQDPHALLTTSLVDQRRIQKVMNTVDIDFGGELPNVTFAGNCRVNGKLGVHLVMLGKNGPVTVLFLPGEMAKSDMIIEHDALQVLILPNSLGSTAIVGKSAEDVETVESTVKNSVGWISI